MTRPCLLMIDQEFAGSLSTRKLVLEAAKLNVMTTYSPEEATATLRKFSSVDGIILDTAAGGAEPGKLVAKLKEIAPTVPVLAIGSPGAPPCPEADHFLQYYEPRRLLEFVQALLPEQTAEINRHDRDLKARS